ncbi:hypothetical protein ccbrp13_52270 [Ktedonobacteria bacterium brp13]|nr:hypothetical protein ccbrp13_52270 [Ktedonobacteria bacterium brp13]
MARRVMTGFLNGPNATQAFFQDFVAKDKVRYLNAFPTNLGAGFNPQTEIVEVFHLAKGDGELQLNYIVQNKIGGPWGPGAGGPFTPFEIWMTES